MGAKEISFLKFDMFEAEKMAKHKDLSKFDKSQIMISIWLGQSNDNLELFWSVHSQLWSKERRVVNQ